MALGTFSLDLSKFVAKAKGNASEVVRTCIIQIGEAVIARTPVGDPSTWKVAAPPGYVGGRARGSWQYGFNAPRAGEPKTIDGQGGPAKAPEAAIEGQAAQARVVAGINANQAPGVHFITSSVPYMRRLEYEAWSDQAPEGMVRVTVLEFQQFVDQAVKVLP